MSDLDKDMPHGRRSEDAARDITNSGVRESEHRPELTDRSVNIAKQLQDWLKVLIIATALLGVVLAASIVYTYTVAKTSTDGLCAMREDAQRRVDDSAQFLIDNPKGIPGISVEQIQRSVDNSRRTIKALSDLDCD